MNDRPLQLRPAGLSHLGLSVTDLDRSVAFYRDVLGARVVRPPSSGDNPSFAGRMAIIAFGPLGVDLFEHESNRAERFDPVRTGLDHIAFAATTLEELRMWTRWLDAHEVARSDVRDDAGVGSILDFTDPDGIQIEFHYVDPERLGAFVEVRADSREGA
jgi:glyoxylase I family protein